MMSNDIEKTKEQLNFLNYYNRTHKNILDILNDNLQNDIDKIKYIDKLNKKWWEF